MYTDIAEEMETKSVFHIFDMIERIKHKIVKISHESSLKQIWDIMIEEGLKMVALESVPDPENKIPGFIQGFLTYTDFLEFFVDNFDGNIIPFNYPLRELNFYYAVSMNKKNDDNIKVIQKDEQLSSVLKKMLDYRIGMVPIVEDMESKRTIGLFYLKDVFWLLRSGKYFNKPVHMLLKAIYNVQDAHSVNSDDEEGEESDDDDQTFDGFDAEDGAQFLEQLDEESKQSVQIGKQNRCRSFGYEEDNFNLSIEQLTDLSGNKEGISSHNNIVTALSKEKIVTSMHKISSEEANINKNKKKSSGSNMEDITDRIVKHGSIELKLDRQGTGDPRNIPGLNRKRATSSVNSYSPEFYTSKRLVAKTKEIFGINRIAIFNRDCTLKDCIEKIM
jgi:CBS domain-containing protein